MFCAIAPSLSTVFLAVCFSFEFGNRFGGKPGKTVPVSAGIIPGVLFWMARFPANAFF
jgi:hypothetical protein